MTKIHRYNKIFIIVNCYKSFITEFENIKQFWKISRNSPELNAFNKKFPAFVLTSYYVSIHLVITGYMNIHISLK